MVYSIDDLLKGAEHLEPYRRKLEILQHVYESLDIVAQNLDLYDKKKYAHTCQDGMKYNMYRVIHDEVFSKWLVEVTVHNNKEERNVLHFEIPSDNLEMQDTFHMYLMYKGETLIHTVQEYGITFDDLRNPENVFQLETVQKDLTDIILCAYRDLHEQFKGSVIDLHVDSLEMIRETIQKKIAKTVEK